MKENILLKGFLLVLFTVSMNLMQAQEYNILDYGAVNDSTKLSTSAIQKAIDDCSANGGGTVIVPKGYYTIGTIFLKDNVNLYIESLGNLLGSTNLQDYSEDIHIPVEAPRFAKCMIFAEDASNISITGNGTINGRGSKENFDHWGERPMHMRLVNCKNVLIEGVTIKNSASWSTHLLFCERVRVNGIHLYNRMQGNNDGIDFDGCKDLFISNSKFDTDDDPICGKSTTNTITENIVVTNCVIRSNCSGFKLGTSSKGIYRNITISNCVMKDTYRGTIKLICVDGGVIENVNISDIVMDNVEGPIFIRLGDRGKIYEEAKDQDYSKEGVDAIEATEPGEIKNISISNIRANVGGKDSAQAGIMITGVPGHYIENVQINNVHVIFPGGGKKEYASRVVPEDAKRYPEQSFFGVLPSYAMYARHTKELFLNNVSFRYDDEEKRPAIVTDDLVHSEIKTLRVMSPSGDQPLMKLKNTRDLFIQNIRSLNNGTVEIEQDNDSIGVEVVK